MGHAYDSLRYMSPRFVTDQMACSTVLINGAGVVRSRSILESTEQDVDLYDASAVEVWISELTFSSDSTYDANVKAHYWTVQAFLPEMIRRGKGHVIVRRLTSSRRSLNLG